MEKTFAVIGGDRRQPYLADLLKEEGWQVALWGVPGRADTKDLERVLDADYILLPLPLSRDGVTVTGTALPLEQLWRSLRPEQLILAGQLPSEQAAAAAGLRVVDYFAREELTVANAVITAEGALQLAMEELDVTLWGLSCLILGHGRIGRLLTQRLTALGAEVTAMARKPAERVWIRAEGARAVSPEQLSEVLGGARLLLNTIPSCILDDGLVGRLDSRCLVIDLASRPGADTAALKARDIRQIWARGLSAKAAPATAAAAVRDAVIHILQERGEIV